MRLCVKALVLATAFASTPAFAGVFFFDLFYNTFYSQTSSAAPTEYFGTNFSARIIATPGNIGTATCTPPNGPPINLPEIGAGYFLFQDNFATEAEVLDAYAQGAYIFDIASGSLGDQTGQITRTPSSFWCEEIPAFTEDSFNAMQAVDASLDFWPGFNTFSAPAPANTGVTFFTIFDSSNNVSFSAFFSPDQGSVLIPAGTLLPGKSYNAVLFFSSRIEGSTLEFGGCEKILGFDRVTSAPLITKAICAGDINNDGFVDDSDFVLFVFGYNILDCADPSMPEGCPADLNADGFVDDADFVIFVGAYNELICP